VEKALDIGVTGQDDDETRRTKRLVTGALWVGIPTTLFSSFQMAFEFGIPAAGVIVGFALLANVTALVSVGVRPTSYPGVVHFVAAANMVVASVLVALFGGLQASGSNSLWGVIVLVGTIVVFADRRAILWLGFFLMSTLVAQWWAANNDPVFILEAAEYIGTFNMFVVVGFVFFVLYYYVRQRALLLEQSESLLRNVLPDDIAQRLKTSDGAIAERFDSATVLFADVVGFTPMAKSMSPEALVALLDEVFTSFDDLVDAAGLEKIKTVGDAYMVAAGVPTARPDHVQVMCGLALAMMGQVTTSTYQGRRLSIRIGVNTGEVVAGIIGTRKFSYDLWGDTVNVASRLQSSADAGQILVTESVTRAAGEVFAFEAVGLLDLRGIGPVEVWALTGRRR
jgi:guanylate cyclase